MYDKEMIVIDTAWMIRNDGRPFPIKHHIYADPEDGEDILCAGEWLYLHTICMQTRIMILRMLVLWTKLEGEGVFSYHRLLAYAEENAGFFPTVSFIKSIEKPLADLNHMMSVILSEDDESRLEKYYEMTLDQLNQEFLRARYGGMYDTEDGCKDIIFRISSAGFDWYPIIYCFVKNCSLPIETVTIVRDAEATGMNNARYRCSDGSALYDRMPIDKFLSEKKNGLPKHHLYIMRGGVKPEDRSLYAKLYEGKSIVDVMQVTEEKSVRTKLNKLREEENRLVT